MTRDEVRELVEASECLRASTQRLQAVMERQRLEDRARRPRADRVRGSRVGRLLARPSRTLRGGRRCQLNSAAPFTRRPVATACNGSMSTACAVANPASHPSRAQARGSRTSSGNVMRGETPAPSPLTLSEFVDEYLEQHVAEANTIRALSDRLKLATAGIPVKPRSTEREHGLGEVRVNRLDVRTVAAWRRRLPDGSAWHAHKALRQVLAYAVRAKLTTETLPGSSRTPSRSAGRFPPSARGMSSAGWPTSYHQSEGRSPSSPAPGCVPRSGLRSSGGTSTRKPGCSMCGASTPTAAFATTGSSRAPFVASRCVRGP